MTPFNHHAINSTCDLIAAIERFDEAGIDPAFDSDMEELERQFAEFCLRNPN